MTREEAIKGHRKMWSWIVKQLESASKSMDIISLKAQWCDDNSFELENDCFACEYSNQTDDSCIDCPIDWGDETCIRLYNDLIVPNESLQTQLEIAKKIKEMPAKVRMRVKNMPYDQAFYTSEGHRELCHCTGWRVYDDDTEQWWFEYTDVDGRLYYGR